MSPIFRILETDPEPARGVLDHDGACGRTRAQFFDRSVRDAASFKPPSVASVADAASQSPT